MILEHLKSRNFDVSKQKAFVDYEKNIVSFPLYSFDKRFVGFQQYNPAGDKSVRKSQEVGRYYTYCSEYAVYGLDFSYDLIHKQKLLIVVEGVFKAVRFHNYNIPAIATLTNNPKPLKPHLDKLIDEGVRVLIIPDNDEAGQKLVKYGNDVIHCSKNVDDMDDKEFYNLLKLIIKS